MATTPKHPPADHQDHAASPHTHGTMDVTEHHQVFNGFVRFMTWGAVGVVGILIFLALTNA